jgi:CheY-like chemotaxis protein
MVEDDENDVYFIQRAFKRAEISNPLHYVRDGEEAINYLSGEPPYDDREKHPLPHLMLLDLKMPRKNGFDVLEWVREQPGLKRLPIVVLTSSREDSDVKRAYDLGANTYLAKPLQLEDLVQMVKALNLYWLNMAERPSIKTRTLPRGGIPLPRTPNKSP